ncbi:expressed unknown protein [Seminavis robusta]|uniref:Uncharacterized protein n=1 Tax=Seminavis robusta TaxID=568900 RepID=A0A9N8DRZ5_9STRA|nr:expressed unknown protein [Seminavis robusta]|eukprot:Sro326_g118270.1 n/a (380) ;mRNA; r:74182-75321
MSTLSESRDKYSEQDEEDRDEHLQSLVVEQGEAAGHNRSALELFLTQLMAEGGATASARSSTSIASSPLPATSFSIIDDRAKALNRSYSLSFRRAKRSMMSQRRRARAIDVKRISRWESYPHSHKKSGSGGFCSLETKPQRRLSPSPSSSASYESRYQARQAIHRALAISEDIKPESKSDLAKDAPSVDFTPCSTWLEVIAKHASYSPKPMHKSMKKKIRSTAVPSANGEGSIRAPAHIPRKGSCDTISLTASLRTKRAAALSGAPRRPRRQASMTDLTMELLSLEHETNHEDHDAGEQNKMPAESSQAHSQRHRHHHSSHHQATSEEGRWASSDQTPHGLAGAALAQPMKQFSDDDASEGSFQDASSAEWKQIGARSA